MKIDNKQGPKQAIGRQGRSLIPFVIAILVVMGLVFGGWGTVYAAQDAQPDDLLYPVKVAVDYLADLTATVPIYRLDRDMEALADETLPGKRYQYGAPVEVKFYPESLPDDLDLTIEETLTTTPTITATQTMSGSMWSWGPGPFEYRLGYTHTYTNGLEYRLGYTHTYTNGLEYQLGYTHTFTNSLDGPPFASDPPLGDPGSSTDPPAPANLGPGESPVKEVNTPAGNSGATETEQKKGGKP